MVVKPCHCSCQAGWYDVNVRIYPVGADEPQETYPQFNAMPPLPGTGKTTKVLKFFAGAFRKKADKVSKL